MGIPVIDEILQIVINFFNSHKYLKYTFLLLCTLFILNIISSFIAGFNVACTTKGEVRQLDSMLTATKIYAEKLSLDDYYECTGRTAETAQAIGSQSSSPFYANFTLCELEVSPAEFDEYVYKHTSKYEVNDLSYKIEDAFRFSCRGMLPTITFYKIDITNPKLWILIFIIGELIIFNRMVG